MSPPISITTSIVLTFLLLLSPSLAGPPPQCGECSGQAKLFYANDCPAGRAYEKKSWLNDNHYGGGSGCSLIRKGDPKSIFKTNAGFRCSVLVYSDDKCTDDYQIDAISISNTGCKNIVSGGRSWQVLCTGRQPPYCWEMEGGVEGWKRKKRRTVTRWRVSRNTLTFSNRKEEATPRH